MKLTIVGVGNLGSTLVQRVLQAGLPPQEVLLIQRGAEEDGESDGQTPQRYGCRMVASLPADVHFSAEDVVIIAVKPQDAEPACRLLRHAINPDTVVLSVMAGVRVSRLESFLGVCKVVRSMPNLGAAVGESASVFFCSKAVVPADLERIEKIIGTMGRSWQQWSSVANRNFFKCPIRPPRERASRKPT